MHPQPPLPLSVACAPLAPLLGQQGSGAGLSPCFPGEEAGPDEKPWESITPAGGGAGASRVLEYFFLAPDSGFAGPWCTSSIPLVLLKHFQQEGGRSACWGVCSGTGDERARCPSLMSWAVPEPLSPRKLGRGGGPLYGTHRSARSHKLRRSQL